MAIALPIHILAGSLGLVSGFIALYVAKGAPLHRKAGMVFVVANGIPAFPFLMFGVIGLLGSIGDFRMMRSAPLQGRARLARHLWRMCTALLIATISFFIGQADVIPKPIRIMPLLALPVLAVFVTMLYWVWRVRFRRQRVRNGLVVAEPVI